MAEAQEREDAAERPAEEAPAATGKEMASGPEEGASAEPLEPEPHEGEPEPGAHEGIKVLDPDGTGVFIPHFESAIPMGDDRFGIDERQERPPRTASFLVAALASLVIIGGTTLIITRPWDPGSFETRAVDAKDTSQVGYPGEVEALTGQESVKLSKEDDKTRDAAAFDIVSSKYERLWELRTNLAENETSMRDALATDDRDVVADGYGVAESSGIETGKIIAELQSSDIWETNYSEDAEHMRQLAIWLRGWADDMVLSWRAMNDAYLPSYAESEVNELMYGGNPDGVNENRSQFEANYAGWEPIRTNAPEDVESAQGEKK